MIVNNYYQINEIKNNLLNNSQKALNQVLSKNAFAANLINDLERELESFSDDIGLVEEDHKVFYVHGSKYNFKITTDIDLKVLESLL